MWKAMRDHLYRSESLPTPPTEKKALTRFVLDIFEELFQWQQTNPAHQTATVTFRHPIKEAISMKVSFVSPTSLVIEIGSNRSDRNYRLTAAAYQSIFLFENHVGFAELATDWDEGTMEIHSLVVDENE